MDKTIILGVGLTRTGTKSLAEALGIMGYKTCYYPHDSQLFSGLFDVYVGISVLANLERLFDRYDNTMLIYPYRNYGDWIHSAFKFFQNSICDDYKLKIREKVYGNSQPTWEDLDIAYKHYFSVFSQLEENCLLLPLEAPNKFELLANFLGKEIPKTDYPHIKHERHLTKF